MRWALEEAGLPYSVEGVPFVEKSDRHFLHQPFGQVPWLGDGELEVFESGAAVLHVAEKSRLLVLADPEGRAQVLQWAFAALNSVEGASLPWFILQFVEGERETESWQAIDKFLNARLGRMEDVLSDRAWLTGEFSAADILMVDVFRVIDRFDGLAGYPACRKYKERGESRSAFTKALADQLDFFARADAR